MVSNTAPRADWRAWAGLAVLALPTLLVSMDISILFIGLSTLSQDLGATGIEQLWILDAYGFVLAGFLVTMGTLGDRVGSRDLMLAGGVAFGLVSLVAAFSTGPEMLIICRGLLGVAGATLIPSGMALVRNMFADERQRSAPDAHPEVGRGRRPGQAHELKLDAGPAREVEHADAVADRGAPMGSPGLPPTA